MDEIILTGITFDFSVDGRIVMRGHNSSGARVALFMTPYEAVIAQAYLSTYIARILDPNRKEPVKPGEKW